MFAYMVDERCISIDTVFVEDVGGTKMIGLSYSVDNKKKRIGKIADAKIEVVNPENKKAKKQSVLAAKFSEKVYAFTSQDAEKEVSFSKEGKVISNKVAIMEIIKENEK